MPIGGHRRQWKTVELVTRNFWWPGVMKEVNIWRDMMLASKIKIA